MFNSHNYKDRLIPLWSKASYYRLIPLQKFSVKIEELKQKLAVSAV